MLLNAIEKEQAADLLKIAGHARCSPVVLNKDSNIPKLQADIQKDYYSHDLYL